MASADQYAEWIVKNADKKGTPEFETVAKAYQEAKSERALPEVPVTPATSGQPNGEGIPAPRSAVYNFVRDTSGAVIPVFTAIAGGAVGTLSGNPIGTALGAGAGYTAGEEAIHQLFDQPAPESKSAGFARGAENLANNISMEAVGGAVAKPIAKGLGWLTDALTQQLGVQKAAKILKEAFGADIPTVRQVIQNAPEGSTAAQSISGVNSPTTQALLERVSGRTPEAAANKLATANAQEAERVNRLMYVADAGSQAEAKETQKGMKNALRKQLLPDLETELNAANIAGPLKTKLEEQAARMAENAAKAVDDARRFSIASGRLEAGAGKRQTLERAMPVPGRYTYEGELAKKAEQVAEDAANASLHFGDASRFATAAANSLEAHGLKPLKTDSIISKIEGLTKNPEFAGNREVSTALNRVASDIKEWTNAGGVIDAWALDSIRKNSINSVVQALLPTADAKAQKALAAKLTGQLRPLIVDAIEAAGGTGYKAYLDAYSQGLKAVSEKKMAAKALEMYQSNPKGFVKLVEGNNTKEVEKVFGAGSYDIAKEMSASAMYHFKKVAGEVTREASIKEQTAAGQQAYKELLDSNTGALKFPAFFSAKTTVANTVLDKLETKLGKQVMDKLTAASKSGESLDKLLSTVPAVERSKILKELSNAQKYFGASGATLNALAPENKNYLRTD